MTFRKTMPSWRLTTHPQRPYVPSWAYVPQTVTTERLAGHYGSMLTWPPARGAA